MTVRPYLGFGSLRPALEAARVSGAGVFVLALTSNPEGAEVQRALRADGSTVAATMLGHLAAENAGAEPLGSVGAVVGATLGDLAGASIWRINGPLLAPGIGAQGATPADLPRRLRRRGAQCRAERQPRSAAARSGHRGAARGGGPFRR